MPKKLLHQAQLKGYKRRADKTVSLSFVTQEVDSDDIKNIDELQDCFGIIYFCEKEALNKEELAAIDSADIDLEDKNKSPSKRLRNVLYCLHEQHGNSESFTEYYKTVMERIITHYKDKLD